MDIVEEIKPVYLDWWFYEFSKLTTIDLTNLNTENTVSMSSIFQRAEKLVVITGLNTLDTSSVTDMSHMFNGCTSLEEVDLSSFNTAAVTDMTSMFHNCDNLNGLDLSTFNTAKVTDMRNMFNSCDAPSFTSLDISHFDTPAVTDMCGMFAYCRTHTDLKLGENFKTHNVTDMSLLFTGCNKLPDSFFTVLRTFDTAKVTNMSSMFSNCQNVETLDLSSFDTSSVTNMSHMFNSCTSLEEIDLSSFSFDAITETDRLRNFLALSSNTKLIELTLSADVAARFDELDYTFSDTYLHNDGAACADAAAIKAKGAGTYTLQRTATTVSFTDTEQVADGAVKGIGIFSPDIAATDLRITYYKVDEVSGKLASLSPVAPVAAGKYLAVFKSMDTTYTVGNAYAVVDTSLPNAADYGNVAYLTLQSAEMTAIKALEKQMADLQAALAEANATIAELSTLIGNLTAALDEAKLAYAAADTALKTELQGNIDAANAALTAAKAELEARITANENAIHELEAALTELEYKQNTVDEKNRALATIALIIACVAVLGCGVTVVLLHSKRS